LARTVPVAELLWAKYVRKLAAASGLGRQGMDEHQVERLLLFKPFARLLPIWGCLLVGKWPPGFQADATLAAAAGGGCAAAGAGAAGVGGDLLLAAAEVVVVPAGGSVVAEAAVAGPWLGG